MRLWCNVSVYLVFVRSFVVFTGRLLFGRTDQSKTGNERLVLTSFGVY